MPYTVEQCVSVPTFYMVVYHITYITYNKTHGDYNMCYHLDK